MNNFLIDSNLKKFWYETSKFYMKNFHNFKSGVLSLILTLMLFIILLTIMLFITLLTLLLFITLLTLMLFITLTQ